MICNVNVEKKNTLKRQSTFQAPFMQKISKAVTSNMTLAVVRIQFLLKTVYYENKTIKADFKEVTDRMYVQHTNLVIMLSCL